MALSRYTEPLPKSCDFLGIIYHGIVGHEYIDLGYFLYKRKNGTCIE